jgi:hypothetical protein
LLAYYIARDIFMKTSIVRRRKKSEKRGGGRPPTNSLYSPDVAAAATEPAGGMVQGSRDRKPAPKVRKLIELGFATSGETKPLVRIRQAEGGR